MKKLSEEDEKKQVLKRFMQEFFHFPTFCKAGLFTKEMRHDYEAQADRICRRLGLKNIYEYGAKEFFCHISYAGKHAEGKPFITSFGGIYDSDNVNKSNETG